MRTRNAWEQRSRLLALFCLMAVAGSLLAAGFARAGERKFLVILANSPKQYPSTERDDPDGESPSPNGEPPGGLIGRNPIDDAYFDTVPGNGIGSFAEFWKEISYGDVTVTGRVTDWISLPWAIQPPLIDSTDDNPLIGPPFDDDDFGIDDANVRLSPANFYDMNNSGTYSYGTGEPFNNELPMIIVDSTGDPNGDDDGPYFPPPKLGDVSQGGQNAGNDVWMPGERFVDVDEDGRWDGFDEANNWMDWVDNATGLPPGDGRPDLRGPWIDLNGDEQADASDDCLYLLDSDNDGNPDCCPNGPGSAGCGRFPAAGACGPTQWNGPNDAEFLDCNGNLVPDPCDIDCESPECIETDFPCPTGCGEPGWTGMCGGSRDELPFDDSTRDCAPGDGDDIPDECQYVDANVDCWEGAADCDDPENPDRSPCCDLPECELFRNDEREVMSRCEYVDDNNDGELDIVEPFENFLRRWDPCLFDPDVQSPNNEAQRTHWIKVYDPNSPSAGSALECTAPEYSVDYADSDYIVNNYPGDSRLVIDQAIARPIYGQHDPIGLATGCTCATPFDPDGDGPLPESVNCFDLDVDGNGTIDSDETGLCVAGIHAVYDPPDNWGNVTSTRGGTGGRTEYSTKMQAQGGGGWQASLVTATPEPGTYGPNQDTSWYRQAWEDRYNVAGNTSTAPPWPMGFDEGQDPVPGGPPMGRPVPNTLKMIPFVDANEEDYDPEVNRRFFSANFGGTRVDPLTGVRVGRGLGWVGDDLRNLFWETGPLDEFGFEEANDHPILPEELEMANDVGDAPIFYDGWVEHDDLPSSKYHMAGDERLGEITSPLRSFYAIDGTLLADPYDPGFDLEEDEPRHVPAIWGEDHGDHDPGTPNLGGDQITPAAGPYATKIHGDLGRDAGNLLLMELLTWRTDGTSLNNGLVWESWHGTDHPFAGPGAPMFPNENLGFRDYNLDGLLDQGEVRPAGSENYLSDSWGGTPNTGTNTVYPFNRRRLLEDCIEVLDEVIDFDDWVDPVARDRITCPLGGPIGAVLPAQYRTGNGLEDIVLEAGVCSGIVLLPTRAQRDNDFPTAPWFYPIHNEDGLGDPAFVDATFPRTPSTPRISWNILFHDLVMKTDGRTPEPSVIDYAAHEYLHTWEGFPDLYDYDVFGGGGVINCPIGLWDIMAGSTSGLVHPIPILKETPCTEWIFPVDLTTVLTPGVDKSITLPPAELVRDDSYFFIENENRPGERFYFWSAGSGFDDPGFPGYGFPDLISGGLPSEGMLILRTDVGANPEALPLQQHTGNHFTYEIVQADGLEELFVCDNLGDSGDPWPGSTGKTMFTCDTDPASRWHTEGACTGLDVLDIRPDGAGSVLVTFSWMPTSIPSLKFMVPPGGVSVPVPPDVIYRVDVNATDVYGGTWIRFFYTNDENDLSIDPDGGNYIGSLHKTVPGTVGMSIDWNIATVTDDRYFLFAELIPDQGADGVELSTTAPRGGRNNAGDGTLTVGDVNTNEFVVEGLVGVFLDTQTFAAFTELGDPVVFLGAGPDDHLAIDNFSGRTPLLRAIAEVGNRQYGMCFDDEGGTSGTLCTENSCCPNAETCTENILSLPVITLVSPVDNVADNCATWLFTPWQITHSGSLARSETWVVECIDAQGNEWVVNSSLTQPEPADDDPNQDPYPHAFTGTPYTSIGGEVTFTISEGAISFTLDDRFAFTTTGLTAISSGVTVEGGQINEAPVALIKASPLAGTAPLAVAFDGRDSFDPNGMPIDHRWDFGDGSSFGFGPEATHTFLQSGTFTVVLRATNTVTNLFGETAVDIEVINNSPNALITASPLSGPSLLTVRFSAAQSGDTETAPDQLVYEWDFGDGETAGTGNPGELIDVQHFYAADGEYIAKLTVEDGGGKRASDTVTILVGNTIPVPSISHTTLEGPDPHTVIFNAANSFDADGDVLTVKWIWGDGQPDETHAVTGPVGFTNGAVEHTYRLADGETAGLFNTYAIVTDERGASAQWAGVSVIVSEATVGPSDPRAIFQICGEAPCGETDPSVPRLDESFVVDAMLSFDRPAGSLIASYTWDFGDGETGTDVIAAHTYARPGTYTITLTVADGENPPNTHSTFHVVAVSGDDDVEPPPTDNHPPTAVLVINPLEGFAGQTEFTFDARSSADQDVGDELTYTWTFGDGTVESGALVTHVYEEPGTYLIRLTVRDSQNASTDATQAITVSVSTGNKAPVAIIATGPRTGTSPVTLTFDGRTSYDPDGDLLEYTWEFRLNGVLVDLAHGATVSRMFDMPGTYTVELEVSDGRGGVSRSESELVEVIARVVLDVGDGGGEPPTGQDVPNGGDSATQRPGRFCGFGMLLSLFGTLLGLSATVATRRRSR